MPPLPTSPAFNYNSGSPFTVTNETVVTHLNADLLDGNHANAFQTALTNPVTGTGTTGYLTRWATGSTVGNSVIYDNGTNVGIGTTEPTAKLDVNGLANIATGLIVPKIYPPSDSTTGRFRS